MSYKIKKVIPITLLSIAILLTANTVHALSSDLCSYIGGLYKYGIGVIGILAAVGIAAAGVMWVTAAGNSSKIKDAQSWIGSSLLGLALALGAFLILSTINPALVNCNAYSFSSIASLGTNYSINTTANTAQIRVFPKSAGYKGTICNPPGDGSGVIWCCVINGKLVGGDPADFADPTIKRCCSPEIKTRDEAEKICLKFYNNYNEERVLRKPKSWWNPIGTIIGNPKAYDYYKERVYMKKPPTLGGDSGNYATVYAKPCWENPTVNKWCAPRVDPQFCSLDDVKDGNACEVSDGVWGYCKNKKCWKCKTWGDACHSNYQCPDQTNKLSTKCGNEIYTMLSKFSNDCDSGICAYIGD
ncbi:MAG: hypothetical protein V1865_01390 [bacterium]